MKPVPPKKTLAQRLAKLGKRAAKNLLPPGPLGDNLMARCHFFEQLGRWPSDAMLFNDVLHRIKTSGELANPVRVFVSDKEHVKTYVAGKIGASYNVPTLAVLRSADEVSRFAFPERCCIKPTHLSGKVMLRLQGEQVDRSLLHAWMKANYYKRSRQLNYRDLRPKIIVEPILFDDDNLSDYKFFCYMGQPRMIQVDSDRKTGHRRCLFDTDWNLLPFGLGWPRPEAAAARPSSLQSMLKAAAILSQDFDFVRVDFYTQGDEIFVGEITNCHAAGAQRFFPESAEADASRLIFGEAHARNP